MNFRLSARERALPTIYIQLVFMALLWAGTFVAGRQASTELDPAQAALLRFGVASVLLVVCATCSPERLPRLKAPQMVVTVILGATGVAGYNLFFFAALSEMPASRTAIFVAFTPLVVLGMGIVAARRTPSFRTFSGCGLSLLGAILLACQDPDFETASSGGAGAVNGQLYMIGAVICWAVYTVVGRRALQDMSPLTIITYASLSGTVMLSISTLIFSSFPDVSTAKSETLFAILYLAIGGTVVPFLWYYRGVAEIGPTRAAAFTHLVPVFGVILGVVVLKEPIDAVLTLATCLVMAGLLVANSSAKPRVSIPNHGTPRRTGSG